MNALMSQCDSEGNGDRTVSLSTLGRLSRGSTMVAAGAQMTEVPSNSLDQKMVDAPSVNAFNRILDRLN